MARLLRSNTDTRLAASLLLCLAAPLLSAAPMALAGQDAVRSTPELVRVCAPTVVTITTEQQYGSGVVVGLGVVATNLHVVQGARKVSVRLSNGDTYDDVAVIDADARKDLVLLKINAFALQPATFGNSDLVEVGERVIAIGTPQGLETTVTEGLVSAIRDSGEGYRVFQTSAPASSGSSGGGLFNDRGQLIGLVTGKLKAGENLNFAVPVNYLRGMLVSTSTMTLAELAARHPATGPAKEPGAGLKTLSSTGTEVSFDGDWLAPRGTNDLSIVHEGDTLRVTWIDRRGAWIATAIARWDAAKSAFSGVAQGRLPCSCGRQPRLERVCDLSSVPVELRTGEDNSLKARLYVPHNPSCQELSFKGGLFEHPGSWLESAYRR